MFKEPSGLVPGHSLLPCFLYKVVIKGLRGLSVTQITTRSNLCMFDTLGKKVAKIGQ